MGHIIGEKWEVCWKGRWIRIPSRETSVCQSRDFEVWHIWGEERIDLVGVDGYVIALGICQDMSYYVSGLELL